MSSSSFLEFRDVISTAAGDARRCALQELPTTLANLAPGASLWMARTAIEHFPSLPAELRNLGISVRDDPSPTSVRDQPWGLTVARAAIAETGSVILVENQLNDRSVSLMTQNLIVLCSISELYPSLDDAAGILREIASDGHSYATFVSGPSRTADIERQLTIGVQGPATLSVVFVDDSSQP